MLTEDQIKQIKSLIDTAIETPPPFTLPLCDFPSLRQFVLYTEFTREIGFLSDSLEDGDFELAFLSRCKTRQTDKNIGLGFSIAPESPVNQLYWNIAKIVYSPANLEEMIRIVLPQIESTLTIQPSENPFTEYSPQRTSHQKRKEVMEDFPLEIKNQELSVLAKTPVPENLSSYVIGESILLDLNQIERFNFNMHASLYRTLNQQYPTLTKEIYKHNHALNQLENNIQQVNKQGKTPREALKDLIRGLLLGGSRLTGHTFATSQASTAYAYFRDYWENLSEDLKVALLKLENSNGKTLSSVLHDLNTGECVETAAASLQALLDRIPSESIIDQRPTIEKETLASIQKQYRYKEIDIAKDTSQTDSLPLDILEVCLQTISPHNTEELILLLLNLPTDVYSSLWSNIQIDDEKETLSNLSEAIKNGFLNERQRQALAEAICKDYQRLGGRAMVLQFATMTNSPTFMREALSLYPDQEDKLSAVKTPYSGSTILHEVAQGGNTELLNLILDLYPTPEEKLEAINTEDVAGNSVLYSATQAPSSSLFNALLAHYPDDPSKLSAILHENKHGQSLIHGAINPNYNQELFDSIMEYYPDSEARLNAVNKPDKQGHPLLYHASMSSEGFRQVLKFYPNLDDLLMVLTQQTLMSTVLDDLVKFDPDIIINLLNSLKTREDKLKLINTQDQKGNTLLHFLAVPSINYPHHAEKHLELLKLVLTTFPSDETRLKAIGQRNIQNDNMAVLALPTRELFDGLKQSIEPSHELQLVRLTQRPKQYGFFSEKQKTKPDDMDYDSTGPTRKS